MSSEYEFDYINGQRVPPLVIKTDYLLNGSHHGSVQVESGELQIRGELHGSLNAQSGTTIVITGKQHGSVSIASGSVVAVFGAIYGSVALGHGAKLVIEDSGILAGSLSNEGLLILRGVFGGSRCGDGVLRIEGAGYVKEPIFRDGANYYEF